MARRPNGPVGPFVHHVVDRKPSRKGWTLDEVIAPVATDQAIRRMLDARVDDAYRLATFILRDPAAAEDIVQEAALQAWSRRTTLRNEGTADGWFTRIVVNLCRDELRRRARSPRVLDIGANPRIVAGPGAGDPGLAAAIERLTPDEQALLALRYGWDLTVPEIADRLDVPQGTVKSRLHSTLEHLRAALDAERRAEEATT